MSGQMKGEPTRKTKLFVFAKQMEKPPGNERRESILMCPNYNQLEMGSRGSSEGGTEPVLTLEP